MSVVSAGDILAGKYRVDRVLGEGGMGVVVAATHLQLDERVALKFMLPAALVAPGAQERFLREARAAVKLKSEHVAKVLDVGTLDTGAPYIVMEFLDGGDIAATLSRTGSLSAEDACDYMIQVCDALSEAHGLGIVHRDLKPANLFVTRRPNGDPLVKVLDFGISKTTTLTESADALTKSSVLLGSPLYMSPEQMKSSRDVDLRTDIWSLGVVLYEMLSGRVPFGGDTIGALMAKVLVETAPPLTNVPPALAAVVARCLEREPPLRYPNVAELARDLSPFAPPRSRLLLERIRPSPASRAELELAKTQAHSDSSSVSVNTGPAASTGSAAWGGTQDGVASRRRFAVPLLIGGAALLAAATFTVVKLRNTESTPVSPGISAVASPTALGAPPPTLIALPSSTETVTASAPSAAPSTVTASARPSTALSTTHGGRPTSPTTSASVQATPSASASAKKKGPLDDWN